MAYVGIFRTMLVAEDQQVMAASIANALSGDAGYFMTPVSASGLAPGEWYISTGLISEMFVGLFPLDEFARGSMGQIVQTNRVYAGHPPEIQAELQRLGMTLPVYAIEELFEALRVFEEPPDVVLSHYGLKLAQSPDGVNA